MLEFPDGLCVPVAVFTPAVKFILETNWWSRSYWLVVIGVVVLTLGLTHTGAAGLIVLVVLYGLYAFRRLAFTRGFLHISPAK